MTEVISQERLNILGASARAAAASAVRAGFAACAVDLFADTDTQALAKTVRIADYPQGFLAAAGEMPDAPWIYTGGLENYPQLIDAIARQRPLWGNTGDVLRAVRDPLLWTSAVNRAGIDTLPVTRDFSVVPRDGTWLAKPLRSAGGLGIFAVDSALEVSPANSDSYYFQQRRPGTSASAVFVAAGQETRLLGATQQLSGAPWTDAAPHVYAGSVGPISLADQMQRRLAQLGDVLADAFGLTGLFGVDGIIDDDRFWPIEINPRYTASIEILERASGANFMQFHADACQHARLPKTWPIASSLHGKAILYTTYASTFSFAAAECAAQLNASSAWPIVADTPHIGEPLPAASPVVTVFATGDSHDEITTQLVARCADLRALL